MIFSGGHKNIRLKNFNYRNGYFFITNKTDFSKPYLRGKIHNLIAKELQNICINSAGVFLDYATIVPNHIHCILILENSTDILSVVWRKFKARCTYKAKKSGFRGKTLWQRNYYEHVIRNDKALERIREYIKNNPLKENLPLDEIYGVR